MELVNREHEMGCSNLLALEAALEVTVSARLSSRLQIRLPSSTGATEAGFLRSYPGEEDLALSSCEFRQRNCRVSRTSIGAQGLDA